MKMKIKKKAEDAIPKLQSLIKFQEERTKDDYAVNSLLRKRFREEKKKIEALKQEAIDKGLGIELLPKSEEDAKLAHTIEFNKPITKLNETKTLTKLKINSSSIFGSTYSQPKSNKFDIAVKKRKIEGTGLLKLESSLDTSKSINIQPTYHVITKS